jgi:hypothetical protein
MIYMLILCVGATMLLLAYFLGKKDAELDESNQRADDIYDAMYARVNADIDELRKKYKGNSL